MVLHQNVVSKWNLGLCYASQVKDFAGMKNNYSEKGLLDWDWSGFWFKQLFFWNMTYHSTFEFTLHLFLVRLLSRSYCCLCSTCTKHVQFSFDKKSVQISLSEGKRHFTQCKKAIKPSQYWLIPGGMVPPGMCQINLLVKFLLKIHLWNIKLKVVEAWGPGHKSHVALGCDNKMCHP